MAATTTNESLPSIPLSRTPDHPPYAQMISDAITSLDEEFGSSEPSISNYIRSNNHDLPPAHDNLLHYHLSKLTRLGEVLQLSSGLFTLPYLQNPNPKPNRDPCLPRKRGKPPKLPRSTETKRSRTDRTVDRDLDLDLDEGRSVPVRKGRGRPPKAKAAGHDKNGGPAAAGGGEVRLLPTGAAVGGGGGAVRRGRGRLPKAKTGDVGMKTE